MYVTFDHVSHDTNKFEQSHLRIIKYVVWIMHSAIFTMSYQVVIEKIEIHYDGEFSNRYHIDSVVPCDSAYYTWMKIDVLIILLRLFEWISIATRKI